MRLNPTLSMWPSQRTDTVADMRAEYTTAMATVDDRLRHVSVRLVAVIGGPRA